MALYKFPFPPRARGDLRTQLTERVFSRSFAALQKAERVRYELISSGRWDEYRANIRRKIIEAFGEMPYGANGGPLNTTEVSAFNTKHCRIENVLFDSFTGWQVNASVFIPKSAGPHPAVVIPVGHSGKQFDNYQIPAQAYASLGFLAVLFDPPGQASEKQQGNDHFRDGVRGFLLGHTSNRYFVLDALRCIDYLETRSDVDLSNGVGMTGVSGGGVTSLFASVFDDRITCYGPSCCMNRLMDHPIGDAYSSCPESFWQGRIFYGIDNVDVALASFPKPLLLMAGKHDEVFAASASKTLADVISSRYRDEGRPERFTYFEDDSGHAYTLRQVEIFSAWMRRWVIEEQNPERPELNEADFSMLDYEKIRCRPSPLENMYSISREIGRGLAVKRPPVDNRDGVAESVRLVVGDPPSVAVWEESEPFRLWMQRYTECLCAIDRQEIPLSLFRPYPPARPTTCVVYIDELGRKHALEAGGMAQSLTRMVDRDPAFPLPLVVIPDLPGWGDCEPALTPYAVSGWGSIDRTLSYTSCGLGEGIFATKVRCAAGLIRELTRREEIPAERMVVVGRGLGGMVSALAGALIGGKSRVVTYESLASFQLLLEEEFYDWPAETFLPSALLFIDIPDVLNGMAVSGTRCIVINPLDGRRDELDKDRWARHCSRAENVEVVFSADAKAAGDIMQETIETVPGTGTPI